MFKLLLDLGTNGYQINEALLLKFDKDSIFKSLLDNRKAYHNEQTHETTLKVAEHNNEDLPAQNDFTHISDISGYENGDISDLGT